MSDTQARIDRLRAIRRKMNQTIKKLSDEPVRQSKVETRRKNVVSKSIPARRPKAIEEEKVVRKPQKDPKPIIETRPAKLVSDKPSMEQKFQFFILTRDLMLAASNRQMKNSFRIWKNRVAQKQRAKPQPSARRLASSVTRIPQFRAKKQEEPPSARRSVREQSKPLYTAKPVTTTKRVRENDNIHVPSYSFKPKEEKRKVDHAMMEAAYSRIGQHSSSDSDLEYDLEQLAAKIKANEFTFLESDPAPMQSALKKDTKKSSIQQDQRVTIAGNTETHKTPAQRTPTNRRTPTNSPYSDQEFEFTPKQSPPVENVIRSPKNVRVSDLLNRSKHRSMKASSSSSDSTDDDVMEGYVEQSFTRETSPIAMVRTLRYRNRSPMAAQEPFSKSMPSPETQSPLKESHVRDLSGFEMSSITSSPGMIIPSPVKCSPIEKQFSVSAEVKPMESLIEEESADGYIEQSFTKETSPKVAVRHSPPKSRTTPVSSPVKSKSSPGFTTPVRSAKLAEVLEYIDSLDVEPHSPVDFGTPKSKATGGAVIEEAMAFELSTPYSMKKEGSPPRMVMSTSPRNSGIINPEEIMSDESEDMHTSAMEVQEIVIEASSPYKVKTGEYIEKMRSASPIREDILETSVEYTVRKGSSPPKKIMSPPPKQLQQSPVRIEQSSSDEGAIDDTEVMKHVSLVASFSASPRKVIESSSDDSDGMTDLIVDVTNKKVIASPTKGQSGSFVIESRGISLPNIDAESEESHNETEVKVPDASYYSDLEEEESANEIQVRSAELVSGIAIESDEEEEKYDGPNFNFDDDDEEDEDEEECPVPRTRTIQPCIHNEENEEEKYDTENNSEIDEESAVLKQKSEDTEEFEEEEDEKPVLRTRVITYQADMKTESENILLEDEEITQDESITPNPAEYSEVSNGFPKPNIATDSDSEDLQEQLAPKTRVITHYSGIIVESETDDLEERSSEARQYLKSNRDFKGLLGVSGTDESISDENEEEEEETHVKEEEEEDSGKLNAEVYDELMDLELSDEYEEDGSDDLDSDGMPQMFDSVISDDGGTYQELLRKYL